MSEIKYMKQEIQLEELLNMTANEIINKVEQCKKHECGFVVFHGEKVFLPKEYSVSYSDGLIVRLELEETTPHGKAKIKGRQTIVIEKEL